MGDMSFNSVQWQDPIGLNAAAPLGNFWEQVIPTEQTVRFDEYDYPAYDFIITKKMGGRSTMISGKIIIMQSDEDEVQAHFETDQAILVNNVDSLTEPRGTIWPRVRCLKYAAGPIMRWDSKNAYWMEVDFVFKALEAANP